MEANSRDCTFWQIIKNDKGDDKIYIIQSIFITFLERNGYRKLINGPSYQLIKITRGSIIEVVETHSIREKIKDFLYSQNLKEVWEVFLYNDYLSKKYIESLKSISISFNYGSESTAVFFYENGVLFVTQEICQLNDYEIFEGYVWKNNINRRKIESKEFDGCEFQKFLYNISGQSQERLICLETAIGYLLHTHKDPALTKAIILIDEEMDNEQSQGGTGKSLIAEGIKKVIPVLKKDGKQLKSNDKFFFADVELFHEVIVFDDVKRNFDFESLYSVLTGDMPIEKKYKNPTNLEFKDVPKVLITSNYVVIGTGGNSEKRRKVIFEVNSYYRVTTSITQEFGHRFFDDWNNEEWLKFDNYMISCVKKFLEHGLLEAPYINAKKNRLIEETNKDFVEFLNDVLADPGSFGGDIKVPHCKFDRAQLFDKFIEINPHLKWQISPHSFKKWIDTYAGIMEIEIKNQKSNGKNFTYFYDVIKIQSIDYE